MSLATATNYRNNEYFSFPSLGLLDYGTENCQKDQTEESFSDLVMAEILTKNMNYDQSPITIAKNRSRLKMVLVLICNQMRNQNSNESYLNVDTRLMAKNRIKNFFLSNDPLLRAVGCTKKIPLIQLGTVACQTLSEIKNEVAYLFHLTFLCVNF